MTSTTVNKEDLAKKIQTYLYVSALGSPELIEYLDKNGDKISINYLT